MDDEDLMAIGNAIRTHRTDRHWTLDQLADAAGVSKSLLSKVENARSVISLPVFIRVARALDVQVGDLVRDVTRQAGKPYLLSRPQDRQRLERDDSEQYVYDKILSAPMRCEYCQVAVLTVHPGAQRPPVTNDGKELLYILAGSCRFHLGDEVIDLVKSDALFFDGEVEHRPENLGDVPFVCLVVYFLRDRNG